MFAAPDRLKEGEAWLKEIAASLQLDPHRFERDFTGDVVKRIIEKDKSEAFVYGFISTPVSLING